MARRYKWNRRNHPPSVSDICIAGRLLKVFRKIPSSLCQHEGSLAVAQHLPGERVVHLAERSLVHQDRPEKNGLKVEVGFLDVTQG